MPNAPATDTEVRIMSLIAWALVVAAMILAAAVLIMGLAGQAIARDSLPEWSGGSGTRDTIAPPVTDQPGDGSMLRRPCDPIFERCEATR